VCPWGPWGVPSIESAQTLAPDACNIALKHACVRYRTTQRTHTYTDVLAEICVAQRARNRAAAACVLRKKNTKHVFVGRENETFTTL
jgi:hypothetical protein